MNPDRLASAALALVPEGPLVVALGGGADSSVAAWVVARRANVTAVFVRHGLAGSRILEDVAHAVADRSGIALEVLDAPVGPGPSLEDRARRARWHAIETAAGEGATVVTGHTRDDQAETVLMNLLRGSGSAGIAGMSRARPGVVRPLMAFTRLEVRSVAEQLGLPFADDPGNEDRSFLRNRIRSELLPMLDREYRPGVAGVLARTGDLAAGDDRLLDDLAERIPIVDDAGAVMIPVAALETAPHAVASRAVRRALRRLLSPYAGTYADVEAVLSVSAGRLDAATISDAIDVRREGPFVTIDPGVYDVPSEVPIVVPSVTRFGAATVRFAPGDADSVRRRSTLLIDGDVLSGGALLRRPAPGDRIEIEDGSKPVRTVLSERGVPVRHRSTWPLVVAGGRIAAIIGIRVAPWARPAVGRSVAVVNERGQW